MIHVRVCLIGTIFIPFRRENLRRFLAAEEVAEEDVVVAQTAPRDHQPRKMGAGFRSN